MAEETELGISYREDLQAWWPLYDHAPVKCMQFVQNGLPAIDVALKYCKQRRVCVQAGGHAGFWPKKLAEHFDHVHTFEPERALFECLKRNCTAPNVTAHANGLGPRTGLFSFKSHISAGSWRIDPAGDHQVMLYTIDSLDIKNCDAILLDIEGFEVEALHGAVATIIRCSPTILVELLPRSKDGIERFLYNMGYGQVARYGRDGIWTLGGK